jgi:hypothetical protein
MSQVVVGTFYNNTTVLILFYVTLSFFKTNLKVLSLYVVDSTREVQIYCLVDKDRNSAF